jgi:hypothetical protein
MWLSDQSFGRKMEGVPESDTDPYKLDGNRDIRDSVTSRVGFLGAADIDITDWAGVVTADGY